MKKSELNRPSARKRILLAAQSEFAAHGFGGARVDRIAAAAEVNKAMIFYYFQSKENLYKSVIMRVLSEFFPRLRKELDSSSDPERFMEVLPRVYMEFLLKNPEIIKIVGTALIHDPGRMTGFMSDILSQIDHRPRKIFKKKIEDWARDGKITEKNPLHFILNVIPLCIFSIIGKPMVEVMLEENTAEDAEYHEARIQSIIHLLKKGMLP